MAVFNKLDSYSPHCHCANVIIIVFCLFRVSCCTRKLQETLTWSLKTVLLDPPPTWTALRGVSPSLNSPRRRNQEQNSQRQKMACRLSVHPRTRAVLEVTCRHGHVHTLRVLCPLKRKDGRWSRQNLPDTNRGEPWDWTWWSLPSASLLLLCSAGLDPRWPLLNDLVVCLAYSLVNNT